MPPSKPTQLPYPANEANRQHLQLWLLNYYASSTFNTCEHQPLPLMDTLPMKLMVNPDATPIAHHSPIPVPLHWQDEVKAGLDRDVELGVLEPVPVGEPVTWCHRMVICAKKERQTSPNSRLPSPHHSCNARNTPYPKPIPPSTFSTVQNQENCPRLLERISQRPPPPRRSTLDSIYHSMG